MTASRPSPGALPPGHARPSRAPAVLEDPALIAGYDRSMSRVVRIAAFPAGPRLYVGHRSRRVHHGLVGGACAVIGAVMHAKKLRNAGIIMVIHDYRDFPWTPKSEPEDRTLPASPNAAGNKVLPWVRCFLAAGQLHAGKRSA